MNKAVFLDRDGVLNQAYFKDGKPRPPSCLEEFKILPCVPEALNILHQNGFLLIVVTNQPDVATGVQKLEVVESMHELLLQQLPLINSIKVCYETDNPSSTRYKPKPGMLIESAKEFDIDLQRSYMVGDRWRDIGAGISAGCFTVFIDYGYPEEMRYQPDIICPDLLEAAAFIVKREDDLTAAVN